MCCAWCACADRRLQLSWDRLGLAVVRVGTRKSCSRRAWDQGRDAIAAARRLAGLASALLLSAAVLPGELITVARAATPATPPATFQVGAAWRSIAPPDAARRTHVGGYSDCDGCAAAGGTTLVRPGDEFAVRALYISDGHTADVLVSAPLEGWFAGYQEGTGLGITELRQEAATRLTAGAGLPAGAVAQQNLMVSTFHCHACPTVIGIWGPTNVAYLRYVYQQALAAILDAQRSAVPATLTWAHADLGYPNAITMGQTNANQGWPLDGQMSILQGRAISTGRPVATWVAVPLHANLAHGPDFHEMDDDYMGMAAQWLESHGQGVGVVAAATLGDQTGPAGGGDRIAKDPRPSPDEKKGYPLVYDEIERMGGLVGSTAVEALRDAPHDITVASLGAGESYQLAPVDNPLLLGLMAGQLLPPNIPAVTHDGQIAGTYYATDRSLTPPYAVGNALGVWFTVLRIGDLAVASEPGEAFPHVTQAIRDALTGAADTFVVGNAQDPLGYYYEPWAYPFTFYYSADHYLFNVSKTLAEQNIQGDTLAARDAGFSVTPATSSLTAPTANDYTRYFLLAGVQTWAYPRGSTELAYAKAHGVYPDGSSASRGISLQVGVYHYDGPPGGVFMVPGAEKNTGPATLTLDGHALVRTGWYAQVTVPCPGTYTLEAKLPGTTASWTSVIHVYSADVVTNSAVYPSGTGPHPLAAQNVHDAPASCAAAATGITSAPIPGAGRAAAAGGSGLTNTAAPSGTGGAGAVALLTGCGLLVWRRRTTRGRR